MTAAQSTEQPCPICNAPTALDRPDLNALQRTCTSCGWHSTDERAARAGRHARELAEQMGVTSAQELDELETYVREVECANGKGVEPPPPPAALEAMKQRTIEHGDQIRALWQKAAEASVPVDELDQIEQQVLDAAVELATLRGACPYCNVRIARELSTVQVRAHLEACREKDISELLGKKLAGELGIGDRVGGGAPMQRAIGVLLEAIDMGARVELVGRRRPDEARVRAWIESPRGARYAYAEGDAPELVLVELARRWSSAPTEQLPLPHVEPAPPRCVHCGVAFELRIRGGLVPSQVHQHIDVTHGAPWCLHFNAEATRNGCLPPTAQQQIAAWLDYQMRKAAS